MVLLDLHYPPSCVASTFHYQNHTLCPKLRITKKIDPSNQESFRKLVFRAEKQITVFLTVQLYSGTKKPYILRTTVPPTKKPLCLRPKPYTRQHWTRCLMPQCNVSKLKSKKNVFFTVQPYSGTKKPYILRTTVPPTKKPLCLRPKPYTRQHWTRCLTAQCSVIVHFEYTRSDNKVSGLRFENREKGVQKNNKFFSFKIHPVRVDTMLGTCF